MRAQPVPATVRWLLARALTPRSHVATSDWPRLLHVGTAALACSRRSRAQMARSGRAQTRSFPRALSQRALAALLQRGAVPPAHARGHPAERAVGRDRAVGGG